MPMTNSILLHLELSPGPGVTWDYEVRFESTSTGHSVFARNPYTRRMRTVRRSRKPLTWRTALADIEACDETWVGTDQPETVDVYGLDQWQADILRLAACKIDPLPSPEARLLAMLSDEAIEHAATRLGRLLEHPALQIIQELIEIHAETGAIDVIQEQVLGAPDLRRVSPDEWIERVREACEERPAVGPSMSAARAVEDAAALVRLASGPKPRRPSVRALLFQKWVDFVMPTAFDQPVRGLGDSPDLKVASWIVAACENPGEISDASDSDPALRLRVERFQREVDDFLARVEGMPQATSYAAGIGRQLMVKVSAQARNIRLWVLGRG